MPPSVGSRCCLTLVPGKWGLPWPEKLLLGCSLLLSLVPELATGGTGLGREGERGKGDKQEPRCRTTWIHSSTPVRQTALGFRAPEHGAHVGWQPPEKGQWRA